MNRTVVEPVHTTALVCPERARLMREYRAATERQADGVRRAERMLEEASLNEHAAITETLSELRREADRAAHALRAHRESHGC